MRPIAILLSLYVASTAVVPVTAQTLQEAGNTTTTQSVNRSGDLTAAREHIAAGRYYEARKIADRLLTVDPNDSDAKGVRDEAVRRHKEVADVRVREAETRVRADGATAQDRLALADAYYEAGSYGAAADLYARLPESLLTREIRLRHARSLSWSGKHDAAERVYSRVLKEGRSPELDLEYGQLLSWMGASRASLQTLAEVHRTNPTEQSAIALANAQAWSGNHEAAIQTLTEHTTAHPSSLEASALLSELQASPSLRLERIERLIEAEPYNLALRIEKARLLVGAGRPVEALRETEFIREHASDGIDGLDTIEKQARDLRKAEMDATAARLAAIDVRNVQNADEVLSLAKAYASLADYGTAIRLYEQYLSARPDDLDARVQYARVLSWDKRWAASERQYEMVLQQAPDRADLRLEYAQVLSYDANFRGAVSMFSSLTDISSNPRANLYSDVPPRAHYNLGQIYRWYGWNDHAVAQQNAALALDGSYSPARQELDLVRHLRPSSQLEGRYSYATDSTDFKLHRVDFTGEKWTSRRTGWNATVGRHTFEHLGNEASATAFAAGVNYRTSDKLLVRGRAGATLYDGDLGTRPLWGAGVQWTPNLQSRVALDYNRYDLVYDVFNLRSLGTGAGAGGVPIGGALSINDVRGHYDYSSGGFLSWLADASYGFISDDNRRAALHGLVSFRLWKQPFVAVKADGRYLSYDFRTNRYWSPSDYRSLAGVLQIGQNVRERFFWSLEAKVGRSWERNASSDLRSYSANLTVPVNDALDVVASYTYGKSGRFDNVFGTGSDLVSYWQRHWFAGVRVKRLFSRDDRPDSTYYYDNRPLTGSPIVPGEVR